jgi:hypothetical protein
MTERSDEELDISNEIALLLDRLEAEGCNMRAVGLDLMRYGVDLVEDHGNPADERLTRALREMLSLGERH